MKNGYNPEVFEPKWKKEWAEKGHPHPSGPLGKYYIIDMFPYPSGDGLHVGHVENFTATDILARYKRFRGYDVLHPIGWDAFGLPAENFAIKTGVHPSEKTLESIANFKKQIHSIGLSYDWDREINTSSPEYYKWTQWLFLLFYKNGLAYKKKASVNWCPKDSTVLANEQVVNGLCERCGTKVIQKDLEQWFFKITDFVESEELPDGKKITGLLEGLTKVDWPESTKAAQKNWIGRSEGAEIIFPIVETEEEACVFTTRIDTIFGCSYIVLAPEHPLIQTLSEKIENFAQVEEYLEKAKKKTDLERTELAKEKTGVVLEGIEAVNPFTGKRVLVYVADYVLGSYGTGAVMGVPAHDERDHEFAKKYALPTPLVVEPKFVADPNGDTALHPDEEMVKREAVIAVVRNPKDDTYLCVSWKTVYMHGLITGGVEAGEDLVEAARREVLEEAGYKNVRHIERPEITINTFFYHRVKKQNRWAHFHYVFFELENEELEEVNKEEADLHEIVWKRKDEFKSFFSVFEGEFLASLLEKTDFVYTGPGILVNSGEFTGMDSEEAKEKMIAWIEKEGFGERKVNYRLRDWLISRQRYWGAPIPIVYCDACGAVSVPESDLPVLLPTDVDFKPTGESPLVYSKSFHDVKCPTCGKSARRESDTMDTFVCSSWYYFRYTDPHNEKEFASRENLDKYLPVDFYMGGAEHTVLHLLYARFFTKALMKFGYISFDEPFSVLRHQGTILAHDSQKMSKSKGNVVNPDQIVEEFGADSLRLYEMFMGPLEDMKSWNTESIIGLRRFLEKVWRLQERISQEKVENDSETLLHKTIAKVTEDIETLKFNTAISSLMVLVNAFEKEASLSQETYRTLLVLLSPFAPFIAEELWQKLGEKDSVFLAGWPEADPQKMKDESVDIVIQVNGKLRALLTFPAGASEEEVKTKALQEASVSKQIEGKEVRKAVFIPDKLLNFVVS